MKKSEEVKHLMDKLKISEEEALEVWQFDHSTDQQQKETLSNLGIKEEEKPKRTASPINKVKQMKKKVEIDEIKEVIKQQFFEWLQSNENIIMPQEIKNNQFGFMDKKGNFYSFKLTKHKTIQDGYKV
jgi:hypothetical protein